jgi:hypothetical protein
MEANCAVIADIKASREVAEWRIVFDRIGDVLENVNDRFRNDIVADFTPTVGDEFQIVLGDPSKAYDVCLFFKEHVPVRIRCGVGIGSLEKLSVDATGMRGTALYRARDAIECARKRDRTVFLKSCEDESHADNAINALLHFIQTVEEEWTERQSEVVGYYRFQTDLSYDKVGQHFGITKQSVHQILKSAHWHVLSEGENAVRGILMNWNAFVKRK